MVKVALITGITGQDGSYLAELLLDKGYEVHGVIRRSSSFNTGRIDHIFEQLHLHYGDLLDPMSIRSILSKVVPHEVYNLAAQSHVKISFDQPVYTFETVANGALHMLEAIRDYRDTINDEVRYYQASSSEMFGEPHKLVRNGQHPARLVGQNENTPLEPASPYACGKVAAYELVRTYRRSYGLFAANGILFNHESPRRGETFVTRKITRAVGRIYHGLQDKLVLGNLDARRDWGFAGDYVDAMWRMLQQDRPGDFVIATGVSMSVRGWLEMAFSYVDLDWEDYVQFDERYLRPTEVAFLQGDATKAREVLDWAPSISTVALCDMMVQHDLGLAEEEKVLDRHRLAV